jgi:hypothetical protein
MVRVLAGGVPLVDRVLDRRNQAGLNLVDLPKHEHTVP